MSHSEHAGYRLGANETALGKGTRMMLVGTWLSLLIKAQMRLAMDQARDAKRRGLRVYEECQWCDGSGFLVIDGCLDVCDACHNGSFER